MTKNTLREQAYELIQQKILSGQLAAGQRISENALAKDLGVSRTPVRSAIRQLESDGLLVQSPRVGTVVKKLERRDIAELYEMRTALEGYAAECAAGLLSQEDRQTLGALCAEMEALVEKSLPTTTTTDAKTIAQFVGADMQFHLIILRATGNRRLMKGVSDSRMLSQWGHFACTQQDIRIYKTTWVQHRQVFDALQSGNGEQSRQALTAHIEFSKAEALRVYDRLQAAGDAAEIMQWATATGSVLP